jgi:hypothetical protein
LFPPLFENIKNNYFLLSIASSQENDHGVSLNEADYFSQTTISKPYVKKSATGLGIIIPSPVISYHFLVPK